MADYYRILSGAIEAQNISGEADRKALFIRARTALEAQFTSMDQELAANLIKSHQQDFDDAIAKINEELSAALEEADAAPNVPVVESSEAQFVTPPVLPPHSPTPSPTPRTPNATPQASAYVAPPNRVMAKPGVAPELSTPAIQSNTGNKTRDERKRSPAAVLFAILFVLVASGTAFGLWKRDLVSNYTDQLGEMTGLWNKMQPPIAPQDAQSEPIENLENVDGADEPPAPVTIESSDIPPPDEVAALPEQQPVQNPVSNSPPGDESAPIPNETSDEVVSGGNSAPAPQPPSDAETTAQTTAQTAGQTEATNPIELPLRAFFLIEKSSGGSNPDDRFSGAAKWRFDADTKILHIETFFPQRNSELNIEIVANSDASFPASHTVTYQHKSLSEKPDGAIINFPALMVREDAGSEGKPLKGAGAMIVPDKYILGLSEVPDNIVFNLSLIDKAKWLVVPVVFDINNRRALFVIEKGPQGARAFATALGAWEQGDLISE